MYSSVLSCAMVGAEPTPVHIEMSNVRMTFDPAPPSKFWAISTGVSAREWIATKWILPRQRRLSVASLPRMNGYPRFQFVSAPGPLESTSSVHWPFT